jgi:hypothetical protein
VDQISALLSAWDARAYVLFAAILVNLLIAMVKGGWLGTWLATKIPPRYLPLLAVLVSALSVGAGEVVAGKPWQHALLSALFTAASAIAAHQTVVEGLRGGREVVPMTKTLAAQRSANDSGDRKAARG